MVGHGLHGGPRLELSTNSYFSTCTPVHLGIRVSSVSFGSFRNYGVFDEHRRLPNSTSYKMVDFEHDSKEMKLFVLRKASVADPPGNLFLLNKFSVSYLSIHSIIVHYDTNDGRTTTGTILYFFLKFPPKIFASLDPNRYRKKQGNDFLMEFNAHRHTHFYERVREIPECSWNDFGRCDVLKLEFDQGQLVKSDEKMVHEIISRLKLRSRCRVYFTDIRTVTDVDHAAATETRLRPQVRPKAVVSGFVLITAPRKKGN